MGAKSVILQPAYAKMNIYPVEEGKVNPLATCPRSLLIHVKLGVPVKRGVNIELMSDYHMLH